MAPLAEAHGFVMHRRDSAHSAEDSGYPAVGWISCLGYLQCGLSEYKCLCSDLETRPSRQIEVEGDGARLARADTAVPGAFPSIPAPTSASLPNRVSPLSSRLAHSPQGISTATSNPSFMLPQTSKGQH